MLAIIKTGGKQYKVAVGDVLRVEKIATAQKSGDKIIFDQVLLTAEGDKIKVGQPWLDQARVEASLVRNFKDKKIDVFKYKSKVRYRRRYGHRQQLAEVKIEKIVA